MKATLWKVWWWVRWPLLVVVLAYVVLVGFRTKYLFDKDKSDAAVVQIHATKLTKEVLYSNLPPEPDVILNNSTLAGVDSNKNGIRDDVERAIYFKHQDSEKITAAEYQYAMALQKEFTSVFDSATLVAVIQEENRAFLCVGDSAMRAEVEKMVFNTQQRENLRENIRENYGSSYKLLKTSECDISF